MPTQQEINAANVELQIANDNYAALANQYNRYRNTLQAWADADPETRERSKWLADEVVKGLEEVRWQMYAAEDRINVAQNRVNSMNEAMAAQQAQQAARRRVVIRPTSAPVPDVVSTPDIVPTKIDNTSVANNMFGPGNYQRLSTTEWDYFRRGGTTIYPDGSISFGWEPEKVPESLNLYNKYYSYKADPNNWMHYLNYLHQTMPNYFDTSEVGRQRLWMRMVRDWLNPWQADEFMSDWEESFTP